ncbi:uncharacterized protein LOC106058650 isoform X1 [Biomphalaria glabrata]|uniref:Uncharacterized protein LOC106058650 isoform X1 n=1 Tax=Biomphalaria glabrata TaxID=6526 RepID=A0A9W2ZKR0_BIOGL|nr:uncharacterized protein LOC106058650 isoform X1 [Biomphalaria glabrata]
MTFKMSTSETVGVDSNAIYHELSPKIVLTVRVVNALTLLMVLIAVILCFVQGHKNGSYYLLVCNLIISMVVSTFVNWWYRSGDLGSEKYWFVILVSAVIMFQCISTDVYVFKEETSVQSLTTVTPSMNTSTAEWSTMIPPSTRPFIFSN